MTTARQLQWSEPAIKDLSRIARHVAISSLQNAHKLLDRIEAKVEFLATYPGAGRIGVVPGTRELVVHKHYFVIYRASLNQITVLRVKHVARKPLQGKLSRPRK
jgi:plasmid stabilization system protein ParE